MVSIDISLKAQDFVSPILAHLLISHCPNNSGVGEKEYRNCSLGKHDAYGMRDRRICIAVLYRMAGRWVLEFLADCRCWKWLGLSETDEVGDEEE